MLLATLTGQKIKNRSDFGQKWTDFVVEGILPIAAEVTRLKYSEIARRAMAKGFQNFLTSVSTREEKPSTNANLFSYVYIHIR
jgi:hypothetical protein